MWETLMEPLERMAGILDAQWSNMLVTLILLLGGWLVARAIRLLLVRGLRIARLDLVADKAGIEAFLRKGGIKQDAVDLLGALVYWLAIIVIIMMIMKVWEIDLGLSTHLIPFLPRVFVALVVLILGLYIAAFVGDAVRTATANAGVTYSKVVGQSVQYLLAVVIILTALRQLGIETELISWGFLLILGSICLGFGLALGLGAKDIVAKRLQKWLDEMEKGQK